MNDGRFISSYVRSSVFDQYVRNMNKLESSHEYRHFLQNNGNKILNNMKAFLHETQTCSVNGRCLPLEGPNDDVVRANVEKKITVQNNKLQDLINQVNQTQNQKKDDCSFCKRS
jgi:hypothetical protein